jgi:cytochrome c553
MRINSGASIVLVTAVLAISAVRASDIDLHWLWDDRCAACHGHAGDFARKFLIVTNGELQGPHHVHDLRRFLHNHYLAGNEVDAVYNMLFAQANNQARYKGECVSCHDTAAKFVRNSLGLRDGVLYSRNSGRPVSHFLDHHMDLNPDDVAFFTNLLTRVAHEVYRP